MADPNGPLLSKISAVWTINSEIFERIEERAQEDPYLITTHTLHLPEGSFALLERESEISSHELISEWQPDPPPPFLRSPESGTKLFLVELDYSLNSYKDLRRINNMLKSATSEICEVVNEKHGAPFLRLVLHNLEIVQTLMGELETMLMNFSDIERIESFHAELKRIEDAYHKIRHDIDRFNSVVKIAGVKMDPSTLRQQIVSDGSKISADGKSYTKRTGGGASMSTFEGFMRGRHSIRVKYDRGVDAVGGLFIAVTHSPQELAWNSYSHSSVFGLLLCLPAHKTVTSLYLAGAISHPPAHIFTNDDNIITATLDCEAKSLDFVSLSPPWNYAVQLPDKPEAKWHFNFYSYGSEFSLI